MCGLLRYSLYGTSDAARNWEEELGIDTQRSQVDERERVSVCGKVATVHGDDITIDGERSAVEFIIKMISRMFETKKQVIGEEPDFEKSGRILNRVIEWDRDHDRGRSEARQREILKGLELERANHSATPCAVERRDERKGENRRGRTDQDQAQMGW